MPSIGGKLAKHEDNPDRSKNDFYPTEPEGTITLIDHLDLLDPVDGFKRDRCWEPACGQGHISKVLMAMGFDVISTDLVASERGYGQDLDFLTTTELLADYIITNPPYSLLNEFIRHGLELNPVMLALHVPHQALLQVGRKRLLEEVGYPQYQYIFVPTLKVDSKLDGNPTASVFNHVWAVWFPRSGKQLFSYSIMVDWREHKVISQKGMF
jgi:hypothetical protein